MLNQKNKTKMTKQSVLHRKPNLVCHVIIQLNHPFHPIRLFNTKDTLS